MTKPIVFPDNPGWSVEIEEVSANVFRVRLLGPRGPSMELTGANPDELIEECRQELQRLSKTDRK